MENKLLLLGVLSFAFILASVAMVSAEGADKSEVIYQSGETFSSVNYLDYYHSHWERDTVLTITEFPETPIGYILESVELEFDYQYDFWKSPKELDYGTHYVTMTLEALDDLKREGEFSYKDVKKETWYSGGKITIGGLRKVSKLSELKVKLYHVAGRVQIRNVKITVNYEKIGDYVQEVYASNDAYSSSEKMDTLLTLTAFPGISVFDEINAVVVEFDYRVDAHGANRRDNYVQVSINDGQTHGKFSYCIDCWDGVADSNVRSDKWYSGGKIVIKNLQITELNNLEIKLYHEMGRAKIRNIKISVAGEVEDHPVAGFEWSPVKPRELESVQFTDTSGIVGSIESWYWNFGDGGTSSEQNPSHTYSDADTYAVELTVIDSGGLSDSITQIVTVLELGPPLPDLTITEVSTSPEDVKAGELVLIYAIVKNIGDGVAAQTNTKILTGANGLICKEPTEELERGESTIVHCYAIYPDEGTYSIQVIADYDEEIGELDETNNQKTSSVSVGGKDGMDMPLSGQESDYASALTISDVSWIETDSFGGVVNIRTGTTMGTFGTELAYISQGGNFVDRGKNAEGNLVIEFRPTDGDWEEQTITLHTDIGEIRAYLPGGATSIPGSSIFFYVAGDGSTYYAREDHKQGMPDMDYWKAADPESGHLARAAPESGS